MRRKVALTGFKTFASTIFMDNVWGIAFSLTHCVCALHAAHSLSLLVFPHGFFFSKTSVQKVAHALLALLAFILSKCFSLQTAGWVHVHGNETVILPKKPDLQAAFHRETVTVTPAITTRMDGLFHAQRCDLAKVFKISDWFWSLLINAHRLTDTQDVKVKIPTNRWNLKNAAPPSSAFVLLFFTVVWMLHLH